MAFRNTIASTSDPIINMVKTANVVLSQMKNEVIRQTLNDHAFPRIRLRILSATASEVNGEGTGSNSGVSIWFTNLSDMSDPLTQATVDSEIDLFIQGNPLIKDGIYSIAARLAAAALTTSQVGQVAQQFNISKDMDDLAMKDLEKLIRTPFFSQAIEATKETTLKTRKLPRIYVAADINDDDATYNTLENRGVPYSGSLTPGQAQLFVNWGLTDVITYQFPAGTTPAQIVDGITQAWRVAQQGRQLIGDPFLNVAIAPDEGRPATGIRQVQYLTYPGMVPTALRTPIVSTNLGFLELSAGYYDKSIDYVSLELSLKHESVLNSGIFDLPGVPGILYGIEPVYSGLTVAGPHSAIIDLLTGERAQNATTTAAERRISDTFYFGISQPADPASATAQATGVVTPGDQFDVTADTVVYSYTAILGDTLTSVVATLANAIQTGGLFAAAPDGADPTILRVSSLIAGDDQNGVAFAAATTSTTATFTTGFSILDGGRDANTIVTSGQVQYRFQEMIDTLNPVPGTVARTRSVAITRGEPVLDVVRRIADDMATFSVTSRCLGAVRAPTVFKIMGTPFNAPGLSIVPYIRDTNHFNVVFDILSVPAGLLFAPLPYDLLPQPATYLFDDKPKSLVVPTKTLNASGGGAAPQRAISETNVGQIRLAEPKISTWLQRIQKDVERLKNIP